MVRRGLLAWMVVAAMGVPVAAQAQPSPAPVMPSAVPARTGLAITTVRATKGAPSIDPRLAPLRKKLERTGFTAFEHVDTQRFEVPDGQVARVRTPDGHDVVVTVVSHDAEKVQLAVKAHKKGTKPVDLEHTVSWNRALLWAFGSPSDDEAILLVVHVRDR